MTKQGDLFGIDRKIGDINALAKTLIIGGMNDEEIYQVLDIINNQKKCGLKEQEIFDIIQTHAKRKTKGLADEVRVWVSVTDGNFSVTECNKALQSVTSVTNRNNFSAAVRMAIKRLKDEGYIRKTGEKDGVYRRVNGEAPEIDWLNAEEETWNIKWPFGIEEWVKTYPKNIIIIAGSPDAGKTAFLLNTVLLNMLDHPIHYFSSEMGKVEMKMRLSKFDEPLTRWKFRAVERDSNFADCVVPDQINMIDFLELTGAEGAEFYKIGAFIKEIYNKLTTGVAIIALQKQFGTNMARGGIGSLEKARLYITLERGNLKIVKAKNWATEVNPNNLNIKFKLIQGAKFIRTSEWKKEYGYDGRNGKAAAAGEREIGEEG